MPIVSSQIVEDRLQSDGRRHVRERHTDNLGRVQDVVYMAESGANVTTAMNARVADLNAALIAAELAANAAEVMGDDV
jgi:hypothetical protein